MPLTYLWLVPLGLFAGLVGTLIGAGGAFVLMPALLILYPHDSPSVLTSISLAVVFFNALTGSIAYARQGRVDIRSGLLFAAATIPSAVLGALTTSHIPRHTFDALFGTVVLGASVYLFLHPGGRRDRTPPAGRLVWHRVVTERNGTVHRYSYHPVLGALASAATGYLSGVLGIGGGIVHVPVLANLLGFPVHVATATSHFTLAFMAGAATATHVVTGAFSEGARRTAFLAVGVVAGAPFGARLSSRLSGDGILRALAVALGLVGLRLVFGALFG